MKMFFEVESSTWLGCRPLNLGLYQEMAEKEADPSYQEYRVQPGVIDLDHLELVALKRVSKQSWMPHFRLIKGIHGYNE